MKREAVRVKSKPVKKPNDDGTALAIIIGSVVLLFLVFRVIRSIFRSKPVRWVRSFFKLRPLKFKSQPVRYLDSRGYIVLSQVNETEHRYIAKQILGRDLAQNEIVHHINGNKTDNRIWNLCLMDGEKHEHFHSWLRWKKEKDGRYPSFKDQKRILEKEYGGTLLENFKRAS